MMSPDIVEIDGSLLEGGGQILRMALTLSALTGIPVWIKNIRAGRSKTGLMEQHLKGLELVCHITRAKVTGDYIGSGEVKFIPGRIKGGSYRSLIKTAGSISLLLQVALPLTFFADSDTTLTLQGGTNAEMAPQIDYTTEVFKPVMEKFGATFDFDLIKRGYFPKGGGEVLVNVKPIRQLFATELTKRGDITSIHGWSFVAGSLPLHLAHTMANSASKTLASIGVNVNIERYKETPEMATGNCSGIILIAESNTGCILGASALGKRQESPEKTGQNAAADLLKTIQEGCCVDRYSQDQIIIFMALANGKSRIRVGEITLHTKTAIAIVEKLTRVKFEIIPDEPQGTTSILQCDGIGMVNQL